jgi:nitronate monooxygenase
LTEKWRGREAASAADSAELARNAKAREADDFDTVVIHAGEAIDLVHAIEPAGAIVARVIAEAEAALARRFV